MTIHFHSLIAAVFAAIAFPAFAGGNADNVSACDIGAYELETPTTWVIYFPLIFR